MDTDKENRIQGPQGYGGRCAGGTFARLRRAYRLVERAGIKKQANVC